MHPPVGLQLLFDLIEYCIKYNIMFNICKNKNSFSQEILENELLSRAPKICLIWRNINYGKNKSGIRWNYNISCILYICIPLFF